MAKEQKKTVRALAEARDRIRTERRRCKKLYADSAFRNAQSGDRAYSTPLNDKPLRKSLDKFRGCLIGGAAGDALGYAVEFLSEPFLFQKFGPQGITEYALEDGLAHLILIEE